MMTVYVGGLGEGKTLGMVWKAMQLKTQHPNMKMYANFPNNMGAEILKSWKQLEQMKNAIILIDEGHIVFDSRDYKNNVHKTHFILLSRHFDLIILITTQVLDQLDLRVRRVIDYMVLCQKKKDRNGRRYFEYGHYKSSSITTGQFTIGRKECLWKPECIYPFYDTKGTITALT